MEGRAWVEQPAWEPSCVIMILCSEAVKSEREGGEDKASSSPHKWTLKYNSSSPTYSGWFLWKNSTEKISDEIYV